MHWDWKIYDKIDTDYYIVSSKQFVNKINNINYHFHFCKKIYMILIKLSSLTSSIYLEYNNKLIKKNHIKVGLFLRASDES